MTPSIPDTQLEQFINDSGWEPKRLGRKQSLIPGSYLQEAVQVYESMNELDDLVTEDNLVIASTDCEGAAKSSDIYADDNLMYSLFLNILGNRKDSLKTMDAINNHLLKAPNILAKNSFHPPSFSSGDNALLGILYEELDEGDKAIQLYETIHNIGFVRDDNLVVAHKVYRDEVNEGSVFSLNNCLWGLFLNRLGKEDEALKVLRSMEDVGIVQDDGTLNLFANNEGKWSGNIVSTDINGVYGMFLKALGKEERVKQLTISMKDLGLIKKGGDVKGMYSVEDGPRGNYPHPKHNIYYGLFLQSIGDDDGWKDIYSALKGRDELWREDGLIMESLEGMGRQGDISSCTNCLYGLFLLKGYHVFTGDIR